MPGLISEWLYSFGLYLRICLFMASPSDLPASVRSLQLTLVAYFIAGLFLLRDQYGPLQVLAHIAIEMGIFYALCFLVLRWQRRLQRMLQTMSALVGSSLVVSLVSIPVSLLLPQMTPTGEINTSAMTVNLMLLFWNLAVISLIFKRAFEVPTIAGGFVAFNFFLIYELIVINFLQ